MSDASTFRGRREWMNKQRAAGIPEAEFTAAFLAPRACPYWKDRYCICKSQVFKLLPDSAAAIGSACGVFPGDKEAADVEKCKWRKLAAGELIEPQAQPDAPTVTAAGIAGG
jgi:hypothetical protein